MAPEAKSDGERTLSRSITFFFVRFRRSAWASTIRAPPVVGLGFDRL